MINLLPDVRQAKLRERRRRQLVGGVSVLVWVICGAVVGLMSLYELGQKAVIAGHDSSIRDSTQKLQAMPGLLDALTAQQHSASLPGLYGQRVYMSKFLDAYAAADPTDVTVTSMTIDTQNALVVNGFGRTYASVAKLARAMEASNVTVGPGAAAGNSPYFADVTITNVSNSAAQGISFTLNATMSSGVTSASSN